MVDVEFKAKINAYVDGDGIYNGIMARAVWLTRVLLVLVVVVAPL